MSAFTGAGAGLSTGKMKDKVPSGYKAGQLSQFTPEQMQLFQSLIAGLQPGLGKGMEHLGGLAAGDQSKFAELEAPAMRQFSGLMGGLASRFSGMGTGARRSSGFGLAGSTASQEFAERLQSQRLGLQNQAIEQLMGLSQSLLGQRPYENFLTPKQKPFWQELLGSLAGGAGMGLGSFGGMYGAKQLGL